MAALLLCAALAAITATATESESASWPPRFTAAYDLYNRGVKVAEMQRVMEPAADGTFRFRSETHTTGLFSLVRKDRIIEESRWRLAGGDLQSLAYTYTRTGSRERRVDVTFDWDTRRIVNSINGDAWRMPAVPEVVDKLLYQFALMYDLRAGNAELNYTVADGGKIKIYEIEPLGAERVRTPLGQLEALKFRHQKVGDDRVTTLWCAPRFQYLPVQVEYLEKDGSKVRVVLQSVTGL
jgi:hypothetical protein